MAPGAPSIATTWGSTPAERSVPYPCDRYLSEPADDYYRAVDVEAPAPIAFRWLCQLRASPYSYDWIDNRGRRSPRRLTPGLDELEVGQSVMSIFELVEFEPGHHLTLVLRGGRRLFGEIAGTYMVVPGEGSRSRLVMKLRVRHPGPALRSRIQNAVLPWLDLVMMRKQLLTLKELAEQEAAKTPG